MSTRINTNTLAMSAARYGQLNDTKVASDIEKLSSGLRINRASDDAAGLVISQSLKAQISGVDQAIRNSNEAANVVKTAEGALGEYQDLLNSMRTLANHAANTGANDPNAIAADQAQIANAVKSLDRIASSTSFGNLKLLDGSASTKVLANTTGLTTAKATGSTVRGTYAVDVTTAGAKGSASGASALDYGKVTGTATASSFTALTAGSTLTISDSAGAAGTLGVNETVVVDLTGASSLTDVVDKINKDTTASKYVSASINASGFLVLDSTAATTATNAAGFVVGANTSAVAQTLGIGGGATAAFNGTATAATTDKKIMQDINYTIAGQSKDGSTQPAHTFAVAKGTSLSDTLKSFSDFAKQNGIEASLSLDSSGTIKVTNNDVGTNRGIATLTANGADTLKIGGLTTTSGTNMALSVNGTAVAAGDIDGSKVNVSAASGVNLKNAAGLSFTVNNPTSTTLSDGSLTVGGGSLKFQIGANAGDQAEIQLDSASTSNLGTGVVDGQSVSTIDVTTAQGAKDALSIIDKAISDVSTMRAKMGAFQSQVLESNTRSLGIAKENLTASVSTITDTDMAATMVDFTKNNILSQASQAMLSQANNSSQGILQLLRG